jgi:molybdate transport system regulatory protein
MKTRSVIPRDAALAIQSARPRVRIVLGEAMRLGPGKVDLLEAIRETGSISAAGRKLGMSYRRAWLLVEEVNGYFRRPIVVARTGGSQGGGADVTDFGKALMAAYRRIEERTLVAIREELAPFETDLVDPAEALPDEV